MDDALLAMLGLQPGETVLWEGRPLSRELKDAQWMIGRLKIIAWAAVPIGGILFCLSRWGQALTWGPYLFILIPSALWLYGAGSTLLVAPFTQARRRRNTRYVLTNHRAITVVGKRGRTEVSSIFLDMAASVTVEERPDGTGTVLVQGAQFENVPDARAVHQEVVAAVRAAGGFEREVVPELEDD